MKKKVVLIVVALVIFVGVGIFAGEILWTEKIDPADNFWTGHCSPQGFIAIAVFVTVGAWGVTMLIKEATKPKKNQ